MKKNKTIPFILIKYTRFEFWPFWFFYLPMYIYGIYLAIKAGSFAYFTTANPAMKYGGAFGMDKNEILDSIDSKYIPKGFIVSPDTDIEDIEKNLQKYTINFPIICKPNVGERGIGVEKIDHKEDLNHFMKKQTDEILIQEFIDFPIELGVFYHRFPISKKDGITSIVRKEFLSITGNGKSTFGELVHKNLRAQPRLNYLKNKYKKQWNQIVADGIRMKLEPIGNHNRGTKFMDGNYLINEQLVAVFRKIADPIDGFYYGRFDLKVKSMDDLFQGENIKIIELNGTNSEPAHIYDPDYSLIQAYKDIAKHMKLVFDISLENKKLGIQPDPFKKVLKALYHHLK